MMNIIEIEIDRIVPSPFPLRKYFDDEEDRELAASIEREGTITPITVRRIGKGKYEVIAGHRRLRAYRDFTAFKTIHAVIVEADDLEARRIAFAENDQRKSLSAIETIEGIVGIVDAELIEDEEYAALGKTSKLRVSALLGKLHSILNSRDRGSKISKEAELLLNKFVQQVNAVFEMLPNQLKWRSFYVHDLPLVTDFFEEVQDLSVRHRLNKSRTKALQKVRIEAPEEFAKLERNPESGDRDSGRKNIGEMSAAEIEKIAQKAIRKVSIDEHSRSRTSPSMELEIKIFLMYRLGILIHRIAALLGINRKTVMTYSENPDLEQSIQNALSAGHSHHQVAKDHGCPEPLVWSIALEKQTDLERFASLGWWLRPHDLWSFGDLDHRLGDEWPGRIPAQIVGHALHYFSNEGDLVLDPMAGGGVVADTCLAFGRRCWSFDLLDRPEERPEIEPHLWDPNNLTWPVEGIMKPDLIFLDPPYFKKKAKQYAPGSISSLSRSEYLRFFEDFLPLLRDHSKKDAHLAFLNADWRDFQSKAAMEEDPRQAIMLHDYIEIMVRSGWRVTHIIDCPMSQNRFKAHQIRHMYKKRTLGTIRRYLIVGRKK
jgi:ParB/RepB/Spo0J family partition protein